MLYCGPNSHTMLDIDCHCEQTGLQSVFHIAGQSATPVIHGFSYKDHQTFASRTVFRRDPAVRHVTLQHAQIEIGGFHDPACTVFDDPAQWRVTGSYYSANTQAWNGAACFTGLVQLGNDIAFAGGLGARVPSGPTPHRPSGLGAADAGRLFPISRSPGSSSGRAAPGAMRWAARREPGSGGYHQDT